MVTPPNDRIEIVLMANQADPLRLWVQSTAQLARKVEYTAERSPDKFWVVWRYSWWSPSTCFRLQP